MLQTSDRSSLGRDDDESKAASGGRRRDGKDEVGMMWVCSGVVFRGCGLGSRDCCLERASRVSGRASENRCPGRAILPPIPHLLR